MGLSICQFGVCSLSSNTAGALPSISSEHTLRTWSFRVSEFLTEMIQQIHSLRASGLMSFHAASAFEDVTSAFLTSAGKACTVPKETFMVWH